MPIRSREPEEPMLPPGWYDDLDTGGRRYFDGQEWAPTVMEMLNGGTGRSIREARWSWGSRMLLLVIIASLLVVAAVAFGSVVSRWEQEPPLTLPTSTPQEADVEGGSGPADVGEVEGP